MHTPKHTNSIQEQEHKQQVDEAKNQVQKNKVDIEEIKSSLEQTKQAVHADSLLVCSAKAMSEEVCVCERQCV